MGSRVRFPDEPAVDGGLYFASESARPYFSTGCHVLDLEMGGGYSSGQLINIAGDWSAGKSLFAAEAAAEFKSRFPEGIIRIKDAEDAWDAGYLQSIGIPMKSVEMVEARESEKGYVANTIEAVQKDIYSQIDRSRKKKVPVLYIVDSWDVLTNDQELSKGIDDANAMASKAKVGSEFARRLWHILPASNVTIIIISQLRSSLNPYGPKDVRGGGRWLDFTSSQILWLSRSDPIHSTRNGVKRVYGRWSKVVLKKNRRTGDSEPVYIPMIKGYGIDDLMACVRFLIEVGKCATQWGEGGAESTAKTLATKYMNSCWRFDEEKYQKELGELKSAISPIWTQIVKDFAPRRKKRQP